MQLTGCHRGAARVDENWLARMIGLLERCDPVRQRLVVVINDLALVRDGRLVLAHGRAADTPGGTGAVGPAAEVSVRLSRPVQIALTHARSPIVLRDIAAAIATEFPTTDAAVIDTHALQAAGSEQEDAPRDGSHHIELTCQLHAASVESLEDGDFRLVISGVSRAAGTTAGRFLDLLDPADRQRMITAYAGLPPNRSDALRAQVSCAPLAPRAANVARTAEVLTHQIILGTHAPPGALALADLAVTADVDGLHLVSLSLRRAVEPTAFDAVEPGRAAHPMQRFLCEISTARSAMCLPFSWGAASHLPFLPRVRYGLTVLSTARWRLASTDLPTAPASTSTSTWGGALAAWRERRHVPRLVQLGDDDRWLRLDLTEPAHQHLLRDALDRHREVTVQEVAKPGAFGWLGGRAHELVLPLASTHTPLPTVRPATWRAVTRTGAGELPGAGRWLSAVIVAHPLRHQTILTEHLPALLAMWPAQPRFWFIRHHDPEHHIRLRIEVYQPAASGVAAQRIAAWALSLREHGLVGSLRFETYHPETGRFGDGPTLTAAEAVFAADSRCAIAQAVSSPDLPSEALAAAGAIDLVTAFVGHPHEGLRWCVTHFPRTPPRTPSPGTSSTGTSTTRAAAARTLRDRAILLADPDNQQQVLREHAGGDGVIAAWRERRTVLAAYRAALHNTGHPDPCAVLPDLLHLHHARAAGVPVSGGDDSERAWLSLARAAALSWSTRRQETST